MGTFSEKDTVVQMAECTFDSHMLDIVGTLIISGTVIMLHPNGHMDFTYLLTTLSEKQITYMLYIPSYLCTLCSHVETSSRRPRWTHLRTLVSVGKCFEND